MVQVGLGRDLVEEAAPEVRHQGAEEHELPHGPAGGDERNREPAERMADEHQVVREGEGLIHASA